MFSRDYKDIIAGAVLLGLGLFASVYGMNTMKMGTVAQMGPGFFPVTLGFILSGFGIAIFIPAFFRSGESPQPDLRSFLAVAASLLAFGLMVRPFGLLPAIFTLTIIASFADSKLALWRAALLGLALSAMAVLIFRFGLGLQIRLIAWPW